MAAKKLKITLSKQRLLALASLYRDLIPAFTTDTAYDLLIHECIKSLSIKLDELELKDQSTYMLKLDSVEALAFWQTWNEFHISTDDVYSGVLVGEMIKEIDKESKQARIMCGATG